ncbi:MAG: hypothetical protein LUH19_04220, partial [Lachnospiraceae bacterium]|nr:hypothetical protein [Lachnospiraceae bacterium]
AEAQRIRMLASMRDQVQIGSEAKAYNLSFFLQEGRDSYNRELMEGATAQGPVSAAAFRECVRQIMGMELGNLDFRTDQSVVALSAKLEEISGKTQAMFRMLQHDPELKDLLVEDDRTDLEAKLEQAFYISNYYELRKKIITNSHYRTHRNSEISDTFDRRDTPEQRNLTFLIWQAEKRLTKLDSFQKEQWLYSTDLRDRNPQDTRQLRQRTGASEAEYGKNGQEIERSIHAEYFRLQNKIVDEQVTPVRQRLQRDSRYRVCGMQVTMSESFVRYLSNLPRLTASQHMPLNDMRSMVENLTAWPQNMDNAQEVQECQARNLEGLRQYKALMKRQMKYLREKYGNGLAIEDPSVLSRYKKEMASDFTNMQGLSVALDYMKRLPGLFDESDPEDMELDRSVEYYGAMAYYEGAARNHFLQAGCSYAEYKKLVASGTTQDAGLECPSFDVVSMTDTMHLDIQWTTVFDENDIRFSDVLPQLKPEAFQKRLNQAVENLSEEQKRNISWNHLFAEYRNLNGPEATKRMVEKEIPGVLIPENIREARDRGLTPGAIAVPGIGTDDFKLMREIYRDILDHPEKRADYGLANDADFAEFQTHLERESDMGETIYRADAKANLALEMMGELDQMARDLEDRNAKVVAGQLSGQLSRLADSYINEGREYKRGEGTQIYKDFVYFRNRVGMLFFPEHRPVLEQLEALARKQKPNAELTVSGNQVRTFEGSPLTELLQGKELKEGADAAEFEEAVQEFNELYARHQVYSRMTTAGETDESMAAEPLWQGVQHKRGFFQYDLSNRQSENYERWEAVLKRMETMLQ